MALNLCEAERLGRASSPDAEEVVGYGRVEVLARVLVREITLLGSLLELSAGVANKNMVNVDIN